MKSYPTRSHPWGIAELKGLDYSIVPDGISWQWFRTRKESTEFGRKHYAAYLSSRANFPRAHQKRIEP